MRIAYKAHDGQKDRSGLPYIMHPVHLAEQMTDEDSCVVALLHDVVEDTDVTIGDLVNKGFTPNQISAIKAMTHEKTVPYMVYIKKLSKNPLASVVKRADLAHNMDLSRIPNPTESDKSRLSRYTEALRILDVEK